MQEPLTQTPTAPAPDQPVPDEFDLLCEHCGYSLVGLTTSNRCPECGLVFDPSELPLARVPWLFRKRLGTWTAYRETVWEIIRRPTGFAKELCRPVRICAADARTFRRMSIRIAVGTCIVAGMIIAATALLSSSIWTSKGTLRWQDFVRLIAVCIMVPWGILMMTLMFRLATDLPTFIWRGLDSNPIDLAPLHHYASAPLALLPILILPLALLMACANYLAFGDLIWMVFAEATLMFCIGSVVVLIWWIPQRLMRQATGCGWGRVVGLAIYLPLHWVLMFAMCAMGFAVGCGAITAIAELLV